MNEIAKFLNENRKDYVFCGMMRLKSSMCYVGSYKISELDLEEYADGEELSMSDILPLSDWTPDDYANAIDGELENQNYHSFKITPDLVLSTLPDSINNKERIEILKKLFDFIIC